MILNILMVLVTVAVLAVNPALGVIVGLIGAIIALRHGRRVAERNRRRDMERAARDATLTRIDQDTQTW